MVLVYVQRAFCIKLGILQCFIIIILLFCFFCFFEFCLFCQLHQNGGSVFEALNTV